MAVVLALEPNPAQAAILRQLIARVRGAELILVDTKDAALHSLAQRVPALILTSPLLAPGDEADLLARLRTLPNGDRVQTLCTPLFSAVATPAPAKTGLLNRWRHAPAPQPRTDEVAVFAKSIAAYLPSVATHDVPRVPVPPPRPPAVVRAAPVKAPGPVVRAAPVKAPGPVVCAAPVKAPGPIVRTAAVKAGRPRPVQPPAPRVSIAAKVTIVRRWVMSTVKPWAVTIARVTVRETAAIARVGEVIARNCAIAIESAAARAFRASRIAATHAWASPRSRSACAACFVALTAGAPPRTTGSPMPPAIVEVRANYADTEVVLNGASRGRAPLRLHLNPGSHVLTARRQGQTRTTELYVSSGARVLESIEWPLPRPAGALRVTTSPAGARVSIDGRVRGITPITVEDLKPGSHKVLLESRAGTVRTAATIADGETAVLDVPIFSGWIAVFAPVELQIHEKDRLLGTSESGHIMIPPGRHTLLLTNRELGYESTRVVNVLPGAVEAISITEIP